MFLEELVYAPCLPLPVCLDLVARQFDLKDVHHPAVLAVPLLEQMFDGAVRVTVWEWGSLVPEGDEGGGGAGASEVVKPVVSVV